MAIATAALIGGALAAGGSVASAVIGSKAAKKAAKTQATAAEKGIALQREQFEETRADLAPWQQVGEQALNQYAQVLGLQGGGEGGLGGPDFSSFFKSPGYEFIKEEGIKGITNAQLGPAMAGLQSGATLKAIMRFSTGLASQGYNQYIGSLGELAGLGETAAAQTGQFGAASAAGQALGTQTAGEARASGFTESASEVQTGIGGVIKGLGTIFKPPIPTEPKKLISGLVG